MTVFNVLYAEDVPHYTAARIEAKDTDDAIAKAKAFDPSGLPADPDWHHSSARRIVEVTDEDENIVAQFIPLDAQSSINR
jgi:hypothetical protein